MNHSESSDASESADGMRDPLRDLLRQSAVTRFDAGFDDRVLARLAATPALRIVSSDESLVATGRRWLPWLAAAALLLAMLDRRASRDRASVLTTASSAVGASAIPDWSAYQ